MASTYGLGLLNPSPGAACRGPTAPRCAQRSTARAVSFYGLRLPRSGRPAWGRLPGSTGRAYTRRGGSWRGRVSKGPKRRPSVARRPTKMHGSDGATGNLMTAPGQKEPPRLVTSAAAAPQKPDAAAGGRHLRCGPDSDILASARHRNLRSPSHECSIRLMEEQFIHCPVRAEMKLHPEALKLVDDEGSALVGTEFVGWLAPNCQRELSIVVLRHNNSRGSMAVRPTQR
jgi:hypothetical protein